MSKSKIAVVESESDKYPHLYRSPLKFGGRVVKDVTVFRVLVTIEEQSGKKRAHGIGEMTMGTAWAWPSTTLTPEMALKTILVLAERIAAAATSLQADQHPLHLSSQIKPMAKKLAEELASAMKLTEPIPDLAIALALSPLDIALHDAYGRLHEKNSFDCFTHEHVGSDLSHWLGEEFVGKDFSEIIAPQTAPTLFLYHLVGSLDPLSKDDLSRKIGDGLPETLEEWIRTQQLSHLKIKLTGKELDADVGRVVEIDRIATRAFPTKQFSYSLDFNEACENE
jgi:L-alanine-DL-glutamate epimerase-like enolase superfamily enzyme